MEALSNTSALDRTVSLLQFLDEEELDIIQSVAREFIKKSQAAYQPLTERQLLARIDTALDHVQQGMFQDAEDVENELRAEFGL